MAEECAICGRGAVLEAMIEGARLWVCERDARFGKVIESPRQAIRRPQESRPAEFELVPDYASRIKRARLQRALSLEELAKTLLVRENELHHFEEGKLKPEEKTARKIESYLKIQLLESSGTPTAPGPSSHAETHASGMTLADRVEIKPKR